MWARVSEGGVRRWWVARILAFVPTIPFGGCEPHVWGWFLPVFWGGFGAWVKPKIKFAWFVRNILVGRCF